MQEDLCLTLRNMGHKVTEVGYYFRDKNQDEYFERKFMSIIVESHCDAVFTMNYFPVVAKACYKKQMIYISWEYDSPFGVGKPEETLGFATNRIFFFDKNEYLKWKEKGYSTVYHMELAVNAMRLDQLEITEEDIEEKSGEIVFVGNLYDSEFDKMYQQIGEYGKGYVDAVLDTQIKLYGVYLVDKICKDEFVMSMRPFFENVSGVKGLEDWVFLKWFRTMVVHEVTRRERISLLYLLSKHCEVNFYSQRPEPMLSEVRYRGVAKINEEIFKIYRLNRINLNISAKQITSGIPLRVFEILGAGGFCLTNYQPEIAEHFVDGRDLVMYESIEDAYEKAMYYLNHEEERAQIAANGRKAVEKFSFENQLARIFAQVFEAV